MMPLCANSHSCDAEHACGEDVMLQTGSYRRKTIDEAYMAAKRKGGMWFTEYVFGMRLSIRRSSRLREKTGRLGKMYRRNLLQRCVSTQRCLAHQAVVFCIQTNKTTAKLRGDHAIQFLQFDITHIPPGVFVMA